MRTEKRSGQKRVTGIFGILIIMVIMATGCSTTNKEQESELISLKVNANKTEAVADNSSVIIFTTVGIFADGTEKMVEPDNYYMVSNKTKKIRVYSTGVLKPYNNEAGSYDIVACIGKITSSAVTVIYKEIPVLAKILINGDKTKITADNKDTATFGVKLYDQYNVEMTTISGITYSVKNTLNDMLKIDMTQNIFKTSNIGLYKITASVGNITSDEYTVEAVEEATLDSITITKAPTKTIYYLGEEIDLTGIVVTGNYSDYSHKEEIIGVENISGFDSTTVGEKILVIEYNHRTAELPITVIQRPEN